MPSFTTVWVCLCHTKVDETNEGQKQQPWAKPEFQKKAMNFYFLVYFQHKEDSFEVRSLLIHSLSTNVFFQTAKVNIFLPMKPSWENSRIIQSSEASWSAKFFIVLK